MHWDDERGQALQVGAVLLFGALIIALSGYQAFVVPDQNERVEFSHSQQVQNELGELRDAVVSVPGDSTTQSVSVTLGTRYPERVIAMNPGPASGSLRTQGTTDPAVNLSVANATAAGGESDEVGDVWNGTWRNYSTGALVYRPNYNVYSEAPTTVYEHSVLFNEFESGSVPLSDQTLVDGNTISLVALNGSLSETRTGARSLDVRPVSASTTTVSVQNESLTEPLTLRVPTRLPESTWDDLLRSENVTRGGYVRNVTVVDRPSSSTFDTLRVTLKPDETYELRMAKAGLGSGVSEESATYLTDVEGDGSTAPAGGRTDVVVEVRDDFNNPVSGVTVRASTNDTAGTLTGSERTTGSDGRATFTVKAKSGVSSSTPVAVNVSFDSNPTRAGATFDAEAGPNATMTVYAGQSGDGSGGSAHEYLVSWRDFGDVPGGAVNPAEECSSIPCEETLDVTAIANPPDPGKVVTYYTDNESAATLSPGYGSTNVSGEHTTALKVLGDTDVNLSASNTTGADDALLDTVFESTFESGLGVWRSYGTFQGSGSDTTSAYANRGSQSVEIDGGNPGGIVTQPTYDTSEAELLTVEYWVRADGPGADEDLVVEYLPQGGNPNANDDWVEIDRLEGDEGTEFERRARIAADDASHLSFKLRFNATSADSTGDQWYVDDVILRSYGPTAGGGGTGDLPPTADAGGPYSVDEGSSTTLDGTASSDDNGISSYSWTITSGPSGAFLTDANTATPTYNAPSDVSSDQTAVVELQVEDGAGQTDTDTASVTVSNTDSPPSVTVDSPSGAETIAGGSTYSVQWTATDPDGDLASNAATVEYSTDGGTNWITNTTTAPTNGPYDWDVPTLDDTSVKIRVTVEDENSNTASAESGQFTVDSTAPTLDSATGVDDTTIDVTISDGTSGIDKSSIAAGDFTVDTGSIDSIDTSAVTEGATGPQTVTITLAAPVDSDTVTVSLQSNGIDDLAGNTRTSGSATASGMDGVAPGISGVTLDEDGSGNLVLSFDSDEALGSTASDVAVSVDGPSNADAYTFNRADFSEFVSGGTYTYTLAVTQAYDDGDGTYTATVDDALDAAGNNGGENGAGSSLSADYDYSSGPTRQRDPGFAYADVNNDGLYSSADGDFQVDVSDGTYDAASNGNSLVIPDSVSPIDASSVSFKGRNVYVGTDVTSSGATTLEATAGYLNVSNVRVDSNGGGQALSLTGPTINATGSTLTSVGKVTISGSESMDVTDATVRSEGGGQELKVSGSGSFTATDATLTSEGKVTITPSGTVDVDGATIEARGAGQDLKLTGSSVRGVGATLDSAGKITAEGNSGEVRFTSATLDVVDGNNQEIALTSNGEMYLDSAELIGDKDSSFTGSRQTTSNTLYVDGAIFRRGNGASKDFDVSPGSKQGGGPAGVNGTPDKGKVV